MQPCTHMLEYAMVRGSGVATSRKIPLGQHSHMLSLATVKEKKKKELMHQCQIFIYFRPEISLRKKKKKSKREKKQEVKNLRKEEIIYKR